MAGEPRALVEFVPAQELAADALGDAGDARRQAQAPDQPDHLRGAEVEVAGWDGRVMARSL